MGLLRIILNGGNWISIVSCLISSAIVVFLVMPVHEYAHGFAAGKLGDPTPRWQGRMTLNPMAHVDYMGALMIFLIGFGWARPVQVDSRYFNNPKRDMAITALAGPLSNLIFSLLACLLRNACYFIVLKNGMIFEYLEFTNGYMPESFWHLVLYLVMLIFEYIAFINISLAVFNLIPIPPLDGSKILAAVLPERIYWQIMRYERYFYFALIFLLFFGSGFSNFLGRLVSLIFDLVFKLTWFPFDLFL